MSRHALAASEPVPLRPRTARLRWSVGATVSWSVPWVAALLLGACGGGGGAGPGAPVIVDGSPVSGGLGNPPIFPDASTLRATTGALSQGRYAHAATLLEDGRVLVSGGTVVGTALSARAELFLPERDGFVDVAVPMGVARSNHTATRLLDGRVLLCGGYGDAPVGGLMALDRGEVFDPGTGLFSETGRMVRARFDHAAALLPDGRVLLTGGSRLTPAGLEDDDSAEVYDPATNTFALLPQRMAHTHATHACLRVGNARYALAGGSASDLRAQVFDADVSLFAALDVGAGDAPRFNAAYATFASGAMVVAGGDSNGTVMVVTPGGTAYRNSGSALSRPRHYATATRTHPDQVLVVGGVDFTADGTLLSSADLIVEGGLSGALTYATELRFPVQLAAHTATLLADGRVLFCGGLVGDDLQSGRTEAFLLGP